jgi:hypothetical protein
VGGPEFILYSTTTTPPKKEEENQTDLKYFLRETCWRMMQTECFNPLKYQIQPK